MSKVRITVMFLIAIFLVGCGRFQDNSEYDSLKLDLPVKNSDLIDELWHIEFGDQQSDYGIGESTLYIVTCGNELNSIDISTGEIKNRYQIDGFEDRVCAGVDVDNELVAINYKNEVIVFDLNLGKIVYKYTASDEPIVAIQYQVLLRDNILIFSQKIDHKIIAVDISTGKILWDYGGKSEEHGSLTLYKYKDRLFLTKGSENAYYEFNHRNGKIINTYKYKTGIEISNDKQDAYYPEFSITGDSELELWLVDNTFDVFYKTNKNYIYTKYKNEFYFHGTNGELQWMATLPDEIRLMKEYGRYSIIVMNSHVSILDMEEQKIAWSVDFEVASKPRVFINNNVLFLPGAEGDYIAYDLSRLVQ